MRVTFGENQEAADAIAAKKDKAKSRRAFRMPTFSGESLQGSGHGRCQVDGRFEARVFDDFPLQVEENQVSRGVGARVDVVVVAGHRGSFANDRYRVHSVVGTEEYCMGPFGFGIRLKLRRSELLLPGEFNQVQSRMTVTGIGSHKAEPLR